jgi:hypothetical protein
MFSLAIFQKNKQNILEITIFSTHRNREISLAEGKVLGWCFLVKLTFSPKLSWQWPCTISGSTEDVSAGESTFLKKLEAAGFCCRTVFIDLEGPEFQPILLMITLRF